MHKLVIQDDEGKTTVVPLIREEITIGRKEGNTIRLTERNVSRRHARIMRGNGHVQIEDLDSYNGVRVNGSRIQGRCQLSISDRVQIGDYLIELKSDEAVDGADAYGEQRTQPIERVDPMAATPVPAQQPAERGQPTAVVSVDRIQGTPQPASYGAAPPSMADTDPAAGALAAAAPPQVQQEPAGYARLVVLSANFAGREFELDKPAMIIGRTDENDVVVNHRSISRHHAKIVRENGRYAVVDLQSSNGVRVNGEEYGKVELRRGDMIDLGHVRMRFVDVGEDFVFGRDAHAVEIATTGGGRGLLYALLAVVVIGGGIAFIAMRGGGGEETAENTGGSGEAGDVARTDPAVAKGTQPEETPADAAVPSPVAPTNDANVAELLRKADEAISAEDWASALKQAKEVLAIEAGHSEAKRILKQAQKELDNQNLYKRFTKAVDAKNYREVSTLFEDIENDSVYREQARPAHDQLRDEYVQKTEDRARVLASGKKCRDLRKLEASAGKIWTEAGAAAGRYLEKCSTASRAHKTPDRKPPPVDRKPPPEDKTPPPSGKSAAQLTADARAAAKAGQFGKAIRLCEQALSIKNGDQDAAMVCVIASCNLKNASKAKKYIGKLRSAGRKGMARQICLKQGVKVD